MIKPQKLSVGDTVATISPSWGCAGDPYVKWQYDLGVKRLQEIGLNVISAPNSMKGTRFLADNPKARAEDFMWAFENDNVKAVIANIGGNDSVKFIPYLNDNSIINNPKILCGYSDVISLHLYCYKLGLSTFYGDNLLTTIAEVGQWHPYSKYWFKKAFFDNSPIGTIEPSDDCTYEDIKYADPNFIRKYIPNKGYYRVQGSGTVRGRLFGGNGNLMEYEKEHIFNLRKSDFKDSILFFEEIPEICNTQYIVEFFDWLGTNGYLQEINGIIIGKMRSCESFKPFADEIRKIVTYKYNLPLLPIMGGLNFGHTSPMFVIPYGAEAELNIDNLYFSILENGVM